MSPTDAGLLMIVPSRGRPQSVHRMINAWVETDAYADATLVFAIDEDDPEYRAYYSSREREENLRGRELVSFLSLPEWLPMVKKLNACAVRAEMFKKPAWGAIGFMGDDHLPRTKGWAGEFLRELKEMRTGIVFGQDGFRTDDLPTHWAMTPDIIRALGRMVPAEVQHLYCDNAIRDLGVMAGCIRQLSDVLIEHMHPLAGKAETDAGYAAVNSAGRYAEDGQTYRLWRHLQMREDARIVRELKEAHDG